MVNRDLLTEVSIFLRVTLGAEKLSDHAEMCRQQLIRRLITRQGSPPQAYIDMNGSTSCSKLQSQISDYYEEYDTSFDGYKSESQFKERFDNILYNNLSHTNKGNIYSNNDNETSNCIVPKNKIQYGDNMYINPSSTLANTPVFQKPLFSSKPPSNSNSERNSIISLKKDSDTSSLTSWTRGEEPAEVVALSASALRYVASKCGTLGRRERFLFVEHTKQYWVAVVQQSLVLYSTDKDSKPLAIIDITDYQARPVISNNKVDFKFELVGPAKKTYQFIGEKQSDMDKWIVAINAAAKVEETTRLQHSLPPVMAIQETYDQPDSAARPVIAEAEYEMPATVPKRRLSEQHNSEPRQLPCLPLETYDCPEPGVRRVQEMYECVQEELYHCIYHEQDEQRQNKALRRLPSLPLEATSQPSIPQEETYDTPETAIRPVASTDMVFQDELYSVIDSQPDKEKAIHKNKGTNCNYQNGDINYYNIVTSYPEKETEQEYIYNEITEQRIMTTSCSNNNQQAKPPISEKPIFVNSHADRKNLK